MVLDQNQLFNGFLQATYTECTNVNLCLLLLLMYPYILADSVNEIFLVNDCLCLVL